MHISHTLKQHLLVRKVVVTKRPEHENEFFLCFSCVFSCVQLSGLDFPGSQLFNFHHASDILWLLHFPHFKHDTLVLASGEFVDWYPVAAVPSSASPRMHLAHPKQPALKKMVNFGDLMWLVNVQKASVVSLSWFKSTYVKLCQHSRKMTSGKSGNKSPLTRHEMHLWCCAYLNAKQQPSKKTSRSQGSVMICI